MTQPLMTSRAYADVSSKVGILIACIMAIAFTFIAVSPALAGDGALRFDHPARTSAVDAARKAELYLIKQGHIEDAQTIKAKRERLHQMNGQDRTHPANMTGMDS